MTDILSHKEIMEHCVIIEEKQNTMLAAIKDWRNACTSAREVGLAPECVNLLTRRDIIFPIDVVNYSPEVRITIDD